MQNTTTCIFLLLCFVCVTSANAESVNLLLKTRNEHLTEQLSAMTTQQQLMTEHLGAVTSQLQAAQNDCKSQQKTMTDQLTLQESEMTSMQLELGMRKQLMKESLESGKLIEKLARENENLKLKFHECQTYQETVIKELRSLTSTLATTKSDIITEVGHLIYNTSLQSDNTVADNAAKILAGQSQLADDVTQAISKLVNEGKTWQAQNKVMLIQVLAKLEQHDLELKYQKNQQSYSALNTTILNGKKYYFSVDQPRMTWDDSNNFCRNHGMHLVRVETLGDWNLIKSEVEKLKDKMEYYPWSSGSDAAEEGKWKWTATGSDVIFFGSKASGFSNTATYNCLVLKSEGWEDYSCTDKRPFICELNILG